MSTRHLEAPAVPTVVATHGDVPPDVQEYAREKIADLGRYLRGPVLHERVRLTRSADPALERPCLAQATVVVDGIPVRAHVAARTMTEAVDRLHDRLRARIERADRHWEARRAGVPLAEGGRPLEWRHRSERTDRPDYFPRPVEERALVRHKTYALSREAVDEAVDELECLDYDFHLFVDVATGEDSVVARDAAGGYRLMSVFGVRAEPRSVYPVTADPLPAPRLTIREAERRLDVDAWPFVFFVSPVSGRGAVVYRRYDGHYGLVTARHG